MSKEKNIVKKRATAVWIVLGIILAMVAVTAVVFLCAPKHMLTVETYTEAWDVQTEDGSPIVSETETYIYNATLWQHYAIHPEMESGYLEHLGFRILWIGRDSIVIWTDEGLCLKGHGFASILNWFVVEKGSELKLVTPSCDADDVFIFRLD